MSTNSTNSPSNEKMKNLDNLITIFLVSLCIIVGLAGLESIIINHLNSRESKDRLAKTLANDPSAIEHWTKLREAMTEIDKKAAAELETNARIPADGGRWRERTKQRANEGGRTLK
jgi:hypothetical protein